MNNIKKRLKNALLYCFTPDKLTPGRDIISVVREQITGGCDIIQLREKSLCGREKLQLSLKIREITLKKNVIFIVNDNVDIAYFSGADGVHLGQDDVPVEYARQILKDKIIGLSCENLEQFKEAQKRDVDYAAIGPVFPTETKDDAGPSIGTGQLSRIMEHKKKITVAIGGINYDNIDRLTGLNIDIFAVISDIINTDSIKEQTGRIKEKIKKMKR